MKKLAVDQLDALLSVLCHAGYQTIAPVERDGAIVYDEVTNQSQLPIGRTDIHGPGHYRLKDRDDDALFGYTVGPHSWKKFLFPAQQPMFTAQRQDGKVVLTHQPYDAVKRAFIGVRACDLAGIHIQDKVFQEGPYQDAHYQHRRERAFIVALNCVEAASTCFCDSMNAGPKAEQGFDVSLTEVLSPEHAFLVETASAKGQEMIGQLNLPDADEGLVNAASQGVANAKAHMGRTLDQQAARQTLMDNRESSYWEEVGERCLSCANCTMVCPTCFCNTMEDSNDLSGEQASRTRLWDSCFNESFSYVVGGSVRKSTASRYRQWITHKLATWHDQFDTAGCTGCGRCITWCPVGIDITEEVAKLQEASQ